MKKANKFADKLYMDDDFEDDFKEEITVEAEDCNFNEDPRADMYDDYVFIRKKLRYSVAACESVLTQALRDLANNPAPRVVEGCSAIIKTITDCTSQLLGVHEKIIKIIPKKDDDDDIGVDENGIEKPKKVTATVNEIIDALDARDKANEDNEE